MHNNRMTMAAAAVLALACAGAAAQPVADASPAVYVEGGQTLHGSANSDMAGVGVMLPWRSVPGWQGAGRSFYWDLFASQWRGPLDGDHRSVAQIGVLATWRYRFDGGASPWFVEGGVGVSVMDRLYRTDDRGFSTTFQFTEAIGAGYSFGANGRHELSLRLQHFSNAGIKKPNPGENFVRLRYAYHF
jgi:lipid A 3-O-deacylase